MLTILCFCCAFRELAAIAENVPKLASAGKTRPQNKTAGSSIDLSALPPGFDCSKIHELGIDKMESMRAGAIMIACGEAQGGAASPSGRFPQFVQKLLLSPLAFGAADVDLVTGTETLPTLSSLRHTPRPTRITPI